VTQRAAGEPAHGFRRGSRLYWRIWLAVLVSIAVATIATVTVLHLLSDRGERFNPRAFVQIGRVLPRADAGADAQRAALEQLRHKLGADLALFARDGTPIAATTGWASDGDDDFVVPIRRVAFTHRLPDGRLLIAQRPRGPATRPTPIGGGTWLVLIAVAVGVGAYPVVRRLTRRLERLQESVERLGRGDFAARVEVHGHDEVAQLAASFNRAVERIEALVAANRSLLANASHELRSPLARVRMAIELLNGDARPALKRELERDIAELDTLIDEILLASRLDSQGAEALALEDVDLTALAAEECARAGAKLDAAPIVLRGDPRLLRRLLRNLLDNARRYGGDAPVEVGLARGTDGRAELTVCDRGPGVADHERERIFEPFYRARGTAEAAGGVGLGLALVRSIAQRHGGSVACLARDGGGSCFLVRLPIADS
jgi:signal transduction histidine kinase